MDNSVLLPIVFVFGAIIGSFLNVVIFRLNTGVGVDGRSKCMSCDKTLTWKELVPILSWLVLGGRCKNCKSRISAQYPLVELGTAILFGLVAWKFPFVSFEAGAMTLLYLVVVSLLMVITAYDARHKIIPDSLVYIFDAIALASVFMGGSQLFHSPHMWTLLAGPILALPFALLWVISKGKWIGLGDAKLALGIGWLLGLNAGVNAIVLAFWIGAVAGVIWVLVSYGKWKKKVEIPFGPYLILGTYIVLFFGLTVIDLRVFQGIM